MALLEVLVSPAQDPVVLTISLLSVIFALYSFLITRDVLLPASVPWHGVDTSKFLAKTRATYSGFSTVRQRLTDGYEKFGKKDQSYVFPAFMSQPTVVVPKASLSWLLDQPDSVLSLGAAHYDTLEGEYAFTDKTLLIDPYHEHVVHRNLPRRVGELVDEMWDEIVLALDDIWGTDESQYKEIGVFDSVIRIIGRVSNRMFVGTPACRNSEYLDACVGFAQQIIPVAQLMQAIPRIMRPVLGPIASQVGKYYWKKAAKHTIPMIEEQSKSIACKEQDPDYQGTEPNNYITWHIRTAQKEGRTDELTADRISRRLMILNFAAIHTTTMTATNLLFDIFSADPAQGVVEGIREEVTRVFMECNGVWNKAAVAKLIRVDSAIRESMRVNGFFTTGLLHKVVAKEGLWNEKENYHLPYGSRVSMDLYNPMRDPSNYSNPYTYDAFRFSREREAYDALSAEQQELSKELELRKLSMVTTSLLHTGFGHGKHACPGRFFVAQELKMIIAYTVMNYDVEILKERPSNVWLGSVMLPPTKAGLRMKRRARAVVN